MNIKNNKIRFQKAFFGLKEVNQNLRKMKQ
jgi:hypothetical protein